MYAWWLYADEAFDTKHAAARALVDILDPAGRRQTPIHTMLVREQQLGAARAAAADAAGGDGGGDWLLC